MVCPLICFFFGLSKCLGAIFFLAAFQVFIYPTTDGESLMLNEIFFPIVHFTVYRKMYCNFNFY